MNDTAKKLLFPISLLILGLAGIVAYLFPTPMFGWLAVAIAGGLMLIAAIFVNMAGISNTLSLRTTRYNFISIISALLGLAVVIVANLIVNKYDVRKDLTKGGLQSLSEQTDQVLKGLTSEVVVKAFLNPARPELKNGYKEFFKQYELASSKFKVEFVDWDREFGAVERYGLTRQSLDTGTLIFEAASGRTERVEGISPPDQDTSMESKITNALIKVSRKVSKKKLYFLSGHGEKSVQPGAGPSLSQLAQRLAETGMETAPLLLAQVGKIPDDAEIIVIAGPKTDLLPGETKLLESYLAAGGKMLVLIDPESPPMMSPFLAKYGIDWQPQRLVFEMGATNQMAKADQLSPISVSFDSGHPITAKAGRDFATYFRFASPVAKSPKTPDGHKISTLLFSSPDSFEVKVAQQMKVDPRTDKRGPIGMGAAVSAEVTVPDTKAAKKPSEPAKAPTPEEEALPKKEMRLVVIGDSDFATNGGLGSVKNADFVLNGLSWLAVEEDSIAVRPRPRDERAFNITAFRAQIIAVISVAVIPIIMIVAAIWVWISRKRR